MKWSEDVFLKHPGLPSYSNPAQARDKAESTSLADATEGNSDGPVAESTQTMQTFLDYYHPAQAEHMARGYVGDAGHRTSGAKDQATDERLSGPDLRGLAPGPSGSIRSQRSVAALVTGGKTEDGRIKT